MKLLLVYSCFIFSVFTHARFVNVCHSLDYRFIESCENGEIGRLACDDYPKEYRTACYGDTLDKRTGNFYDLSKKSLCNRLDDAYRPLCLSKMAVAISCENYPSDLEASCKRGDFDPLTGIYYLKKKISVLDCDQYRLKKKDYMSIDIVSTFSKFQSLIDNNGCLSKEFRACLLSDTERFKILSSIKNGQISGEKAFVLARVAYPYTVNKKAVFNCSGNI